MSWRLLQTEWRENSRCATHTRAESCINANGQAAVVLPVVIAAFMGTFRSRGFVPRGYTSPTFKWRVRIETNG